MNSVFSFVVSLLTAALTLLGFVQQHPELPQSSRDQAQIVATQAIQQATQALNNANAQPSVVGPASNVSVSGMQKYTDADFGFSFWYPSGWGVSPMDIYDASEFPGGTEQKVLGVAGRMTGTIYLVELELSTTTTPYGYYQEGPPNFGWHPLFTLSASSGSTMGGLLAFNNNGGWLSGQLIPLSNNKALIVYVLKAPGINPNPLARTIVATDPSVATPVSAAQQTRTIQAEKDAYAGN